jgi:hypothetical protein
MRKIATSALKQGCLDLGRWFFTGILRAARTGFQAALSCGLEPCVCLLRTNEVSEVSEVCEVDEVYEASVNSWTREVTKYRRS